MLNFPDDSVMKEFIHVLSVLKLFIFTKNSYLRLFLSQSPSVGVCSCGEMTFSFRAQIGQIGGASCENVEAVILNVQKMGQ